MIELDYIRDPDEIYRRSFQLIGDETDFSGLPEGLRPVASRMVHACGMPDIVADLRWRGDAAAAARRALAKAAPLLVDARMVEVVETSKLIVIVNLAEGQYYKVLQLIQFLIPNQQS